MSAEQDTQRRLANTIRIGTVEQADFGTARVRVRFGNILTGWLPMGGQRAGGMRVWNPLTVGEQVIVLAPSGDLAQGIAIPGTFSNSRPAPGSTGTAFNIVFPDGSELTWDGGTLDFEATGAVKIKAPSIEIDSPAITIKGPITQTGGGITTTGGDHVADGKSLKTHLHTGVVAGGSNTGPPA